MVFLHFNFANMTLITGWKVPRTFLVRRASSLTCKGHVGNLMRFSIYYLDKSLLYNIRIWREVFSRWMIRRASRCLHSFYGLGKIPFLSLHLIFSNRHRSSLYCILPVLRLIHVPNWSFLALKRSYLASSRTLICKLSIFGSFVVSLGGNCLRYSGFQLNPMHENVNFT